MFTELLNGITWKEALEVSGPTHCSKQAKLEQVVQSSFEYVQECDFSVPLYQYLTTLIVNKFFQISTGGVPHAATCIVRSNPLAPSALNQPLGSWRQSCFSWTLSFNMWTRLSQLLLFSDAWLPKNPMRLWSQWSQFNSNKHRSP